MCHVLVFSPVAIMYRVRYARLILPHVADFIIIPT